jgi:hypothetical protein
MASDSLCRATESVLVLITSIRLTVDLAPCPSASERLRVLPTTAVMIWIGVGVQEPNLLARCPTRGDHVDGDSIAAPETFGTASSGVKSATIGQPHRLLMSESELLGCPSGKARG